MPGKISAEADKNPPAAWVRMPQNPFVVANIFSGLCAVNQMINKPAVKKRTDLKAHPDKKTLWGKRETV